MENGSAKAQHGDSRISQLQIDVAVLQSEVKGLATASQVSELDATLKAYMEDQERRLSAVEKSTGRILAIYCSITAAISVTGTFVAIKWKSILSAFGVN